MRLVRIFNPAKRNSTALTFRYFGPLFRFDHHRGSIPTGQACEDPARAVYYAAWSDDLSVAFSSALVEVFGDSREVITKDYVVAAPTVARDLHLLDLRGRGAMRAGTVSAIAKCEHTLSQLWSRYFYERPDLYATVDGLLYSNAHNDEPAIMLYERAREAVTISQHHVRPLHHPDLDDLLTYLMIANGLV